MDPALTAFADAARRYCALMEFAPGENEEAPEEFAQRCLCLLLELYRLGLDLPLLERPAESLPRLDRPVWETVLQSVGRRLPMDYYWETDAFPVSRTSTEECVGSLADDLADIYGELQPGVAALAVGQAPVEAIVHQWRSMFYYHWGEHAANAIRALHFVCVCPFTKEY